jgi:hypothetical protein
MKDTTVTNQKPATKKKAVHTYGAKDITRWKFEEHNLPAPWDKHMGILPQRFIIYIDGDPGNGKTEFQIQFAKMLATHYGKVRINNVEQGKHLQIKQSVVRNEVDQLKPGKFAYCSIPDFESYKQVLKRPNSGRVQFIDSISFFPLDAKQIQELIHVFKHKSFVFIAYKADFGKNAHIRHLCDIKIRVENFTATMNGANRFGGTEDYVIWDRPKKSNGQLMMMV